MIKSYFLNSEKMPLVFEPNSPAKSFGTLSDFAAGERDFLHEQLLEHGAILLRGFEINGIGEFENFVRGFSGRDFFNYAGGVSPRLSLGRGVYTSTEYPSHLSLTLHNELSYSAVYPSHLYFFCRIAPEVGGETTLGKSARILQNISPKTVGLFKHKQVRYDRNLNAEIGSGYSWQDAFETDDRQEVEEICRKIGAEFEWESHNCFRVSQTRPATAKHPVTGGDVWFNQADGFHPSNLSDEAQQNFAFSPQNFRLSSCFGDGSQIPSELLRSVRASILKETIPHRWQRGDVLILDNILAAHGRMPFSGARQIALAMT